MTIYHFVLFKLKPGVTDEDLTKLRSAGEAMVGQIPGLQSFKMGGVLASTAHRAQGYNMGLMTVMDSEEAVLNYASHPAHVIVHGIRTEICTDTIVYDMVLPDE